MTTVKEEHAHLAHLARQFRNLADRTEQAREIAIGLSDFGPGIVHDPQLNEQIDWFYRRWVMRVELARKAMKAEAALLDGARNVYEATDEHLRISARNQSSGSW